DVPLLRLLDARLRDPARVADGLQMTVGPPSLNAAGVLHGGAINTLLDVAAYLAVVPLLSPEEEALTHGFSASYLASASPGHAITARGELLRRTRRLAFVSSRVRSETEVIALASVTK